MDGKVSNSRYACNATVAMHGDAGWSMLCVGTSGRLLALLSLGPWYRCAMWSNWTLGELEKRIDWTFDYVEAGVQWETAEIETVQGQVRSGGLAANYKEMLLRLPLLWEMLNDAPFASVIANSFREVQTFCEDVVKRILIRRMCASSCYRVLE